VRELSVPVITVSQIFLSTGILSPVSIDSSRVAFPEIIFPSTGILSPGFIKIVYQILIFSTSISLNSHQIFTSAFFGARLINFEMA
jgi:hypothetical protein